MRSGKSQGLICVCGRSMVVALVALCAVVGVLVLSAGSALAARGHVFCETCTFGSKGAGPGQFENPAGVAIDEATGDVYVVDKGDDRVEWFSSTGVYEGEFNGSGLLLNEGREAGGGLGEKPTGQFSEPEGIAVDNSCQLHRPEPLTGEACEKSDPSDGDVYVVDVGHRVIDKFSATGAYVGQISESPEQIIVDGNKQELSKQSFPLEELFGVSVDSRGEVKVYQQVNGFGQPGETGHTEVESFSDGVVDEFLSSLRVLIGGSAEPGLAVDAEDDFYAAFFTSEVPRGIYEFNGKGEELRQRALDREDSSAVTVELSSGDAYVDNLTTVARFSPSGSLLERLGAGHLTGGSGIGVSSTTEMVYVADSATDTVVVFTPESPGPPTVEGESVTKVTSGSAAFSAQINPRGESAEYHFEYDTSEYAPNGPSHGIQVPALDASVGAGCVGAACFEVLAASAHPQNLLPDTTYHFRVVTHNQHGGIVDGLDQTFTTQAPGGSLTLLDGRAWEMVSPVEKQDATITGLSSFGAVQAAADGSALTYVTRSPTESATQGNPGFVQVLSSRGTGDWSSRDIATPHNAATGFVANDEAVEYRLFSEDLSLALVEPFGKFTELSERASERTPFLRRERLCDARATESECYLPLVTGKEPYADVPPGTIFGEGATPLKHNVHVEGSTPNLNHVVVGSRVALTETTPVATQGGLYEWSTDKSPTEELQLVSLLPKTAEPAENATLGGGSEAEDTRHAISDDGSLITWRNESNGEKHLYTRDTSKHETVQLDAVVSGGGEGAVEPRFQTASSDGSRVFFTDTQKLTADASMYEHGLDENGDLYECKIIETAGEPECELDDLTPSSGGQSAEILGVIGASEDGAYVYFVANGVLDAGANAAGETATLGKCGEGEPVGATCNLYVNHDGITTFVASLSGEDSSDWAGRLTHLTARVSPDGHWLAFMSDRELTGYDNHDANSDQPDEEVYLDDVTTKHLVCASCNPTGARPVGVQMGNIEREVLVGSHLPTGRWFAANVPGWTELGDEYSLYQSRYLSNNGRLYFNSSDGLVPQDINGDQDVYEYEPAGVGSCSASSSTISVKSGGCVELISSGTASGESAFLDASATGGRDTEGDEGGGDVFFLTTEKLVPRDVDAAYDVYDAHECTRTAPCPPTSVASPPECTTADACRVAPSPQPTIFGAASSATFSGQGNTTSTPTTTAPKKTTKKKTVKCAKPKKLSHGKCVKKKGKQKAKKAKKPNHQRRAK